MQLSDQYYPGTSIPSNRVVWKNELAEMVGISRPTLTRYLIKIERKLKEAGEYNRRCKSLQQKHIIVFMKEHGYSGI